MEENREEYAVYIEFQASRNIIKEIKAAMLETLRKDAGKSLCARTCRVAEWGSDAVQRPARRTYFELESLNYIPNERGFKLTAASDDRLSVEAPLEWLLTHPLGFTLITNARELQAITDLSTPKLGEAWNTHPTGVHTVEGSESHEDDMVAAGV